MDVIVEEADLTDAQQASAVIEIIDSYARGPGGQNAALTDFAREKLIPGLLDHPLATVLLARVAGRPVGTAVCVWHFPLLLDLV